MMTRRTTYALRALAVLAAHRDGPLLAAQVAVRAGVPRRFLNILLSQLVRGGILKAARGRGGGFQLNLDARQISVAAVVRVLDGGLVLFPCLSPDRPKRCAECPGSRACVAHLAFAAASTRLTASLEGLTLADLVAEALIVDCNDSHEAQGLRLSLATL